MGTSVLDRVRQKMTKEYLTVKEIASQAGVSDASLYKWLKGKVNPKSEDAKKLHNWLNGSNAIVPNSANDAKNELKTLIDTIKRKTGLTQGKISEGAGYKTQGLAQSLARHDGHEAVIKRLKMVYGKDLQNIEGSNIVEATPGEIEPIAMHTIYKLIDQNGVLVKSTAQAISLNDKVFEENKKLVDRLLEQPTVNVHEQTAQVVAATLGGFQELLMKVATGITYRSAEEAKAVVDKAFAEMYHPR